MPSVTESSTEEVSKSDSPAMGTPRLLEKGWVSDCFFSKSLEDVAPQGDGGRVGEKRGYPWGCVLTNCISCCAIICFISADVELLF